MNSNLFGDQVAFCEPAWYQGFQSPYYHDGHRNFRAKVRKFVEEELRPNVDKWLKEGKGYPLELHRRAYGLGISGIIYPPEYGGTKPADFDAFYEVIMCDELARTFGGAVLGQLGINSMALPPIMHSNNEYLKEKVLRDVITGKKNCCLAISEPYAGSDVGSIRTTAKLDGDFYIVNGIKKWITGGLTGDYFTTAVRTGGEGMAGISLLLIERDMPGVSVRKMETQFDSTHSTTMVTLENVKVPVSHLIGEENAAFGIIMANFNHERFVIAVSACRLSRMCYQEAIHYALSRKTFGKRLVDHQVVRHKLAEMARQIEALQDNVERVAYQFSKGVPDHKLGAMCALLKVQSTRTLEMCAREAAHVFGGSSVVKEGQGKNIERAYRSVLGLSIPGGAEDILLDFAMRQVAWKASQQKAKL